MAASVDVFDPNQKFPDFLRHMENVTLAFLQALFATLPKGCFHYDEDESLTEIHIEGQHTDNLRVVDARPKIVVARGPVSWGNTSIGSFVGSQARGLASKSFADTVRGSIGISCFSREALEADRLAQICFDSITMFRPVLQKFGFQTIKSSQIGNRGLVKSDARPDLYVVPVLALVEITRKWSLAQIDSVQLRGILLELLSKP